MKNKTILIIGGTLSMIGYLVNSQIGAATCNFIHHKGLGISIFVLGIISANQSVQLAGSILFGHSSMDRVLGYGLKYPGSFQNTHLGGIGKA